jgi:hypothetical protein
VPAGQLRHDVLLAMAWLLLPAASLLLRRRERQQSPHCHPLPGTLHRQPGQTADVYVKDMLQPDVAGNTKTLLPTL